MGLMLGEAVVVFRPELAEDFLTMRKQSLQLVSKMRFVAAQFTEALRDGLWLENARHANAIAPLFCFRTESPAAHAGADSGRQCSFCAHEAGTYGQTHGKILFL